MFGEKIDYALLRVFAHNHNIATEGNLDEQAGYDVLETLDEALSRLRKYMDRFDGLFPISGKLRYLDIGCGSGELCIALAKLGCRNVTGIDNVPRRIKTCNIRAEQMGVKDSVHFLCEDINKWDPPQKYDVVMSFSALEHIDKPKDFLRAAQNFLSPEGIFVLAFGPLFHSPFGDHMSGFFRFQIPWRGVLFSEKAILRLRREFYRPTDKASSYRDLVGGLNLMRYSEFLNYVCETGWKFRFLSVNTFLKRFPPLHLLSRVVARIPPVRDYFAHNVYAILAPGPSGKP